MIVVGRVGKPHGVRGESTVVRDSNDPDRFVVGARFATDVGELVISSVRSYRDRGLIIRFEGVGNRREAERLRGVDLTIEPDDRRDLDDGEFWPDQLIGLRAVTPDGAALGDVVRVEFGSAQDRLVVRTVDGEDVQVPFVSDIVGDPAGEEIVVDAPSGLFPEGRGVVAD